MNIDLSRLPRETVLEALREVLAGFSADYMTFKEWLTSCDTMANKLDLEMPPFTDAEMSHAFYLDNMNVDMHNDFSRKRKIFEKWLFDNQSTDEGTRFRTIWVTLETDIKNRIEVRRKMLDELTKFQDLELMWENNKINKYLPELCYKGLVLAGFPFAQNMTFLKMAQNHRLPTIHV